MAKTHKGSSSKSEDTSFLRTAVQGETLCVTRPDGRRLFFQGDCFRRWARIVSGLRNRAQAGALDPDVARQGVAELAASLMVGAVQADALVEDVECLADRRFCEEVDLAFLLREKPQNMTLGEWLLRRWPGAFKEENAELGEPEAAGTRPAGLTRDEETAIIRRLKESLDLTYSEIEAAVFGQVNRKHPGKRAEMRLRRADGK